MKSDPSETYIRRHSHHVRNLLNSLELEAMLLEAVLQDKSSLEMVGNIRRMTQSITHLVDRLNFRFSTPSFAEEDIFPLLECCRYQVSKIKSEKPVSWEITLKACTIRVDASAWISLIVEIAETYFAGGGGVIKAQAIGSSAIISFQQAAETSAAIIEQHDLHTAVRRQGGELTHDPSTRELRLVFPQI